VLGPACGGSASAHSEPGAQPAAPAGSCRATDLKGLFRGFQASGGSLTGAVVLVSSGSAPCLLTGTPPSVTLLDANGDPVDVRSHPLDVPANAGPVHLLQGTQLPTFGAPPNRGSAWFVLNWTNWCASATPTVDSLLVVLPGGAGSISTPHDTAIAAWQPGPSTPRCDDAKVGSTVTIGRFQAPLGP
jgi:hypothetical protein